jgi:IMP dehydrogenase
MVKKLLEKLDQIIQFLKSVMEFVELSDDGIKTKIPRKCDKFFRKMTFKGEALTYDDVRLRTCYSEVLPCDVVKKSRLSRNIPLNIPIVSSPMGDVTEAAMAIAMAKLGGLGIIHKRLSPEDQAAEVKKVKRCLGGLLVDPVCVHPGDTVEKILKMREKENLKFWSFPVVDNSGKLIGMVTRKFFDFCRDNQQNIGERVSPEIISVPEGTGIVEAHEMMMKNAIRTVPVLSDTGIFKGMYTLTDVKRIIQNDKIDYNVGSDGSLLVGASIGVGPNGVDKDFELRIGLLFDARVDVVVIDSAHGWSRNIIEAVKFCKKNYPRLDVVAGNISEGGAAIALMEAGADGVRIGQGPGSICTTRPIAGVGTPQVTAVYNCAKALRGTGVVCCADGGITYSGDITIALAVGADCVMLGNALAGTTETPGELILPSEGGPTRKRYRGEGSKSAMVESRASRERYGWKDSGKEKLVPEGVESLVDYKGDVRPIVYQLIGGLSSGMGYLGAKDVSALQENADFYQITHAGLKESHPHHLKYVQDAPNYKN